MKIPAYEIEKKREMDGKIYWGVGPNVHVLEMPGYQDRRRFLCMTEISNDCKHVQAVKRYLHITTEAAA